MLRKLMLLIMLTGLVVSQAGPLGAVTLYDDFSTDYIKKSVWLDHRYQPGMYNHENVREINPLNQTLVLKLGTNEQKTYARNGLYVNSSAPLQSLRADVNIIEMNNDFSDTATVFGRIAGLFFNAQTDTPAPDCFQGDIWAELAIGDRDNDGNIEVWFAIEEFTTCANNVADLIEGNALTIPGPPLLQNHPYTLEIVFDGIAGFTFNIYDGPLPIATFATLIPRLNFGLPHVPHAKVNVAVHDNPEEWVDGYVHAEFDNVYFNGLPWDTFDGPEIDLTKWVQGEYIRESANGVARLETKKQNSDSRSRLFLRDKYTPYLEATARILSGSTISAPSDGFGRVRIGGYFYNNTHGPGTYNAFEGDVWAQVVLQINDGGGLQARALLYASNADQSVYTKVDTYNFTTPISYDTDYVLSIDFTGSAMVFKCNSETITHTFQPADIVNPPYKSVRTAESRLWLSAGESGFIRGTIDNVRVADPDYANLTGEWTVSVSDSVATPLGCPAAPDETFSVFVTQNGTELLIEDDLGEEELSGVISGSQILLSGSDEDSGYFIESFVDLTMSDHHNGSGTGRNYISPIGCTQDNVVAIARVNTPPTANSTSATVDEDSTGNAITVSGSDPDGDPLTYTLHTAPTNGTVSNTGSVFYYTPDPNFNGGDLFDFMVDDGRGGTAIGQVSIVIDPVNDDPIATDQSVLVDEDAVDHAITLAGTDIDGDGLTFALTGTGPSNGTLGGTEPDLLYSPNTNYNGPDSFTFSVDDGFGGTDTGTVSITVRTGNDDPTATDQSVDVAEDAVDHAITLAGTDLDGDTLTFALTGTGPSNGTLSGTAPNMLYSPNTNYNGPDSFTFSVDDGFGGTDTGTVSITVTPGNDDPTATDQSLDVAEDAVDHAITLAGSDIDGDGLTFALTGTGPSNGTLSGTAPNLLYTPSANYNGVDSFTFTVDDGFGGTDTGTVSITVTPVNDDPSATDQSVDVAEDAVDHAITLAGSDIDGDTLTFALTGTGPSNGTLSGTAPNLLYSPNTNYNGPDSFTFTVDDGNGGTDSGTVSITVTPVNDPPSANDQTLIVDEDSTDNSIRLTGSDPERDLLTFALTGTGPSNGTLSGTAPDLFYTPNTDYYGPDSFTFSVDDGNGGTDTGTVTLSVNKTGNTLPVADDQTVTVTEDTMDNAITLTGTDSDSDPLTYALTGTGPLHGVLTGTAPDLLYTPDADYSGSDSFTFSVDDGYGGIDSATVGITVTPVSDAPIADDLSVTVNINSTDNTITCTGFDADGDTLTFALDAGPTNGTLSGTAPDMLYTPNADYSGTDSFTFTVDDGTGSTDIGTVTITVSDPDAGGGGGGGGGGGCFIQSLGF